MKPSGIGGMAVIEGVMMRNKDEYAVAVRKPNNEITVKKKNIRIFLRKSNCLNCLFSGECLLLSIPWLSV